MTTLTKVLIGAGVVVGAGVITAVAVVTSKKSDDVAEKVKEEIGVLEKIKKGAEKKVVKILAWVALHMEQIEAASAAFGLISGGLAIVNAVKEFKKVDDTQAQLDRIERYLVLHDEACTENYNHLGLYTEQCAKVINENLKQTDKDVITLAEGLNVKILEDGEQFCA